MDIIRSIFFNISGLGLPAYLVLRVRRFGFALGVVAFWVLPLVIGEIQRADDPYASRFGMGVWLFFGWLFGLVYCLLILGVKKLVLLVLRRLQKERIQQK